MKILLLGAAGFIGTNLAITLDKNSCDEITLVDKKREYFNNILKLNLKNIKIVEDQLDINSNFDELIEGQDMIYHLVSTTIPSTSNQQISQELIANVVFTSKLLDACVRQKIRKVIFISSGGTVYGKEAICPLKEDTPTYPISSYGIQKISIEKLLYLYNYLYGLDYRVIRLANPYGPYQRPNGVLGAVTTFTYKAINQEEIIVYGDGSVIRDFIYIDDAIKAIVNIALNDKDYKTYNVGSGYGTSINQLLKIIQISLNIKLNVKYLDGRKVDVPVNYLDISRYESDFGKLNNTSLENGIKKTANFLKEEGK